MKRLFILVMLLIAGCGQQTGETKPVQQPAYTSSFEVSEAPFTLKVRSAKDVYAVGEKIDVQAELFYTGDEPSVNIGHAMYPIYFETTNVTKHVEYGYAMNEPYIVTTIQKGVPYVLSYHFSGGATGVSDAELQQMADLTFPPGDYRINVGTSFHLDGEPNSKEYKLFGTIAFTVK